MGIREYKINDDLACIECFKDAYNENYYRPLVYSKQGWEKWDKNPFVEILVYEFENSDNKPVAAVGIDFWNPLGWLEYGGLATKKCFRRNGIGTEFMKRNYFYSLEMLKNNSVLFTVPYDSMISNGARKANTIFAGINGIYKLLDQNTFINQRVIFSVYYGVNDIRYHSRVPCFIPEPLKEFYFNQVEFIGTKYRRQYSFRSLRNIAFANAEDPKHLLDIDWSMYSYFTHGEKIQHLKDVSYIIDEDQKVIKILDVKQPGNGLNILLKKKKEGYVLDARINLASKEAPWITNLLSKFNFQIANYTISSITLDPDTNQVMTIKKAREPFPDGINTSDFLEMTTQAHRHCKLVGNSDESQNDPNVVKFLQQYPQDNVIQDYRNRFIVKEKQEVLSKL